ncbi:pectate lyase family protein [Hyphomonas atlantica]|uniref:pectate lyase family protein n=1 Tax=Hyphomonas atlantica TaxID=1280948 RepID=UPI000ADD7FC2|nr:pectate lyase [Hyphomonas atlantica]
MAQHTASRTLALLAIMSLAGCATAQTTTASTAPATFETATPAAPWMGPLGPASTTVGGKGGQIVKVTNLDSAGPGSLREALQAEGPKIIVFEVGGIIDLDGDNLHVATSNITIAGQTAPSPGITLIKGGMVITGDDVIVQHLRIRPGDLGEAYRSGRDIDAITTISARNVIVDHCSLSWATDENLSASGPRFTGDTPDEWRDGTSHTIAYTNNIIAEGLSHSTHAKGEHSKGSLIHDNVSDILIYGNLYAHNFERSPLFKGGVHGAIVNNFIYNPGQRGVHYNLQGLEWGDVPAETGRMDLVGNVMRAGPSTSDGLPLLMIGGDGALDLHMAGNIAQDQWGSALPDAGSYTSNSASELNEAGPSKIITDLPILAAGQVESYVLKHAGARPWDRDAVDVRILADTAEGRGEIIDSQEQVGGYPELDATYRDFDPSQWHLDTMEPATQDALDSGLKAKGT